MGCLYKSIWPPPVYVARFADGSQGRMSFYSRSGKPFDFDRGRKLLAWAYGQAIVDGAVEQDGALYPDMFFAAPGNVAALPRRPSKAATELAKALALLARLEETFGAAFPIECAEVQDFLLTREAA